MRDSLVFGGTVTTASDIAVAAGKTDMGDTKLVEHLDQGLVSEAQQRIKSLLEGAIDIIKTSYVQCPRIFVWYVY